MAGSQEHQTFRIEVLRISFRQFFYVLFVVTTVFVNGYLYIILGIRNPWTFLIPVPLFVAASWAVALVLMRYRFPIRLEPDKIVCCDWLCRYQPVSWESVNEARAWPMMGLSYLRMKSSESKLPLWLPLNVDQSDRLPALIESYAGNDHPIVLELRRIA